MVDLSMNGIIRMERGDTVKFPLFINKGSEICPIRYYLQEEDQLYFALTEPNQPFECALLKKVYTYKDCNPLGDVIIKLTPDETECLIPGKYYYEIKARLIDTHIPLDYDIPITDDDSVVLKGSQLTKGSIILGQPIERLADNELISFTGNEYYVILDNINLYIRDEISYGSVIKAGSILNGTEMESDYIVNTIIKKTEFWIE